MDSDEEEGEDELEEEGDLSEEELRMLDKAEQGDREDIEDQGGPDSMAVPSKKKALGKRKGRPQIDLEYEEEHEVER